MGGRRQFTNRKDDNHKRIVDGLSKRGVVSFDTSDMKKEGFDVLIPFRGKLYAVEIKNPDYLPKKFFVMNKDQQIEYMVDKMLTDEEKKAYEKLRKGGCDLIITWSLDHLLREIGLYQKPFS